MSDKKIDQSLDAIIKENKIPRGRGNSGAARQMMKDGRGNSGRGGGAQKGGRGKVGRESGARRVYRGRGGFRHDPVRGNVDDVWTHDLYNGPQPVARAHPGVARAHPGVARAQPGVSRAHPGVASSTGPTKLIISNLDHNVSENDLSDLYSEFGRLKKVVVHYDKSGRSLGSADIIFERKSDAIKAMKTYNGIPLDGKPMTIQLTTSEVNPGATSGVNPGVGSRVGKKSQTSQSLYKLPFRQIQNDQRKSKDRWSYTSRSGQRAGRAKKIAGRGGRGGKKTAQPKKDSRPAPSVEDLDKEMDTYMNTR